jgi:hypothetical protein
VRRFIANGLRGLADRLDAKPKIESQPERPPLRQRSNLSAVSERLADVPQLKPVTGARVLTKPGEYMGRFVPGDGGGPSRDRAWLYL